VAQAVVVAAPALAIVTDTVDDVMLPILMPIVLAGRTFLLPIKSDTVFLAGFGATFDAFLGISSDKSFSGSLTSADIRFCACRVASVDPLIIIILSP